MPFRKPLAPGYLAKSTIAQSVGHQFTGVCSLLTMCVLAAKGLGVGPLYSGQWSYGGSGVATKTSRLCERIPIMLVLSRRQSETIVIGDNIRVQVLEISGGRVR